MAKVKNPLTVVQSGSGIDYLQYASSASFPNFNNFPNEDIVLNLTKATSFSFWQSVIPSGKKLYINAPNVTELRQNLYGISSENSTEIEEVHITVGQRCTQLLDLIETSKIKKLYYSGIGNVTYWGSYSFAGVSGPKYIYGLDLSSATYVYMNFAIDLVEVEATENALNCDTRTGTYSARYGSRSSFFAIINIFKENAGKTLTRNSYSWTDRLSSITGSSVLDTTGTYHRFVDDGGTMTALEFLTNVKGWTVA